MDLTPGHKQRKGYLGSTEVFEALKYFGLKKNPNYFKLCPIISAVGHCGFLHDPLSKRHVIHGWRLLASCKESHSAEWNICFLKRWPETQQLLNMAHHWSIIGRRGPVSCGLDTALFMGCNPSKKQTNEQSSESHLQVPTLCSWSASSMCRPEKHCSSNYCFTRSLEPRWVSWVISSSHMTPCSCKCVDRKAILHD